MVSTPRRLSVCLQIAISLIVILTQSSCGMKLISAANGRGGNGAGGDTGNGGGGGNGDPSKPACEDLALNDVKVTLPSMTVPPNMQVSINNGAVIYDACRTPGPGEIPFITVERASDTRIAVKLTLWANTPIRNFYFGSQNGVTPVRSDFAISISSRPGCMAPAQTVFSTNSSPLHWQKGTTGDSDCPASANTYHGYLDIY